MMRDIEFRGRRSNGEWVYGSLIALDVDSGYVYITKPYISTVVPSFRCLIEGNTYLVDPNTVGQYTGLKDKNGVKIYEGDLIRTADFDEEDGYGLVEYNDGAFEINGNGISATFHANYWGNDCEVIGNIYDNPESL